MAKKEEKNNEAIDVTKTVIEVLRSLNIIDETGQVKISKDTSEIKDKSKNSSKDDFIPYVSSKWDLASSNNEALDDVLSESAHLPIHQVPGARQSFQGMNSSGVTKGPMDSNKMRTAAAGPGGTDAGWGRGTTSFMGLQTDPLIGNSFSMLNFSLSRSNPYMVNRMYGSGMYGDIPVYFLMMQEQNGGILYWPVSIREKYQWYRYFYRCIFVSNNDLGQVLMSDGTQKDIRNIEVGEKVVTALGTVKKVKETFEKECEEKKAVTVKCNNIQNPIKVTHHHPFYALRNACVEDEDGRMVKDIDFEPQWIHAENLEVGDYLLRPSLKSNNDIDITNGQARLLENYEVFKIKEITYSAEKGMVYNLAIDATDDENSFVCNDVVVHNTDPYVGSIIDLHTDLPISRIGFTKPKLNNDPEGEKAKECLKHCQKWASAVSLFDRILEGVFEWTLIGNCYLFSEWDEGHKWWKKITILPPEEVGIIHFPFSDFAFAEYRPEPLISLVNAVGSEGYAETSQSVTPLEKAIYDNIPSDVVNSIQKFGSIIMDTNPNTGSFVAHLARKRSPYADLGVSTLERVIIPLLQKEHFKYTQLSLSSRLMTPRNKINAPNISPDATDNLRSEIDLSMEDPDYHVVTNFDFSWELIGAENRLLALQPEYERIENEIFSALGATKELVTGESSYGGARITAEILNTRYLLVRDIFQNFVEEKLLKPMAVKNEWFEENEDGSREYYYPKLSFNRLTIRDNQEMFDALFQLYQKGSLPIKVIYELFNLDTNEMNDLLVEDMFTARDSTFNEMLRQIHSNLADPIVQETDLVDRVSKYLGLTKKDEEKGIITTPVPDLGENIFKSPEKDEDNIKEPAPEEEDVSEEVALDESEETSEEDISEDLDEDSLSEELSLE